MSSVRELLLICTAILVAFSYLRFHIKRRRLYKLADELSGPKELPLLGILYRFIGVKSEDIYKTIASVLSSCPQSFTMWAGPILIYVVKDPDDLEIILKSQNCFEKHQLYEKISLPRGLFTTGGDMYKLHRKLITPAFSVKSLRSFMPNINHESKVFVEKMKRKSISQEFDISHCIAEFNLRNLLVTLFGMENLPNELVDAYLADNVKMFKIINERMCKVWLTLDTVFKLSGLYRVAKNHCFERKGTLSDYIMKVNEIDYQGARNRINQTSSIIGDLLYKIRGQVDYEEIKSEIDTMLIAGYDTTATVLSNILLMLAIHQDVQSKVVDEIRRIFESTDGEVSEEALGEMKYLEMVIKECLRLFPLPSMTIRKVTEDLKLRKHLIPTGTSVLYQTLFFHASKQFWGHDANEFNPERFRPENISKVHPFAFIPFAQGPRKCIGHKYAWVVMKVFVCHVVRNFHLTTSVNYADIHLQMEFLLKIKPGYFVKLDERRDF